MLPGMPLVPRVFYTIAIPLLKDNTFIFGYNYTVFPQGMAGSHRIKQGIYKDSEYITQ